MNQRRARIETAFARARAYDDHAHIQAVVAQDLAARIAALPLPSAPPSALLAAPHILEIGAGTGHLTDALIRARPDASLLVTDLAPAMVARAQARIGENPACDFAVLDGEHGPSPVAAPFDLIASSLAFQWFDDPARAAARLIGWLKPGGWLAFTTLAHGTFAQGREAHAALGLAPGTLPLPRAETLAAAMPHAQLSVTHLTERHADARAFLRAVKAIGAATPAPGHRPLGPGTLRQVMRHFEDHGCTASYEVATVVWQRPPL
jgi:malonyl-CoA O-methyltransferase